LCYSEHMWARFQKYLNDFRLSLCLHRIFIDSSGGNTQKASILTVSLNLSYWTLTLLKKRNKLYFQQNEIKEEFIFETMKKQICRWRKSGQQLPLARILGSTSILCERCCFFHGCFRFPRLVLARTPWHALNILPESIFIDRDIE